MPRATPPSPANMSVPRCIQDGTTAAVNMMCELICAWSQSVIRPCATRALIRCDDGGRWNPSAYSCARVHCTLTGRAVASVNAAASASTVQIVLPPKAPPIRQD